MPFFSARPSGVFGIRSKGRQPFLLRQIITKGYIAAGYKDSVAWRNVNSNNHSTDVATNMGDILQEAANYTSGAHNTNNAFLWGCNGTGTQGVGAYTSTSVFNMRNDTTQTKTSAMNTVNTVGDSGTMLKQDLDGLYTYSWQNGNQGAAQIQRFNLTTEQASGVISTSFDQGGTGASTHYSENFGYFWNDSQNRKFVFATETETTPGFNPGFHGQQKGLVSKTGFGYAGNEGSYSGGYNFRVTNYTTEVISSTVAKPIVDCGEENFICGQTKGYTLGMYGAPGPAQNNRSFLYTYATNSGSELGASGMPTGTASGTGAPAGAIGGRSSGHGYWRD